MGSVATNQSISINTALEALRTQKLPWSLQWAQRSVISYFSLPSKFLKGLGVVRKSPRALRREGLERNAMVLMVLLRYVDLATMQVGVPKENGAFLGLTYRFLAKKAGWRTDADDKMDKELIKAGRRPKERGIKRIARFFELLRQAGYVELLPKSKMHNDGTYEGMAGIKRVSPKLFYDLGVSVEQLKKCCNKAKKRLLAIRENYRQKLIKAAGLYVRPVKDALNKRFRRGGDDVAVRKAKLLKIQSLRALPENKDLNASDFYLKYPALKPDG